MKSTSYEIFPMTVARAGCPVDAEWLERALDATERTSETR